MKQEKILIPRKNTTIKFAPGELIAVYRLATAFLDAVDPKDKRLPEGVRAMLPLVGDVEAKICARLTWVAQ